MRSLMRSKQSSCFGRSAHPVREVTSVELAEWQSRDLEGFFLSPEDRRLVERLGREHSGKLEITELLSGVRIAAKSWIGVVRFDSFEVRVIPKLAGENLGLVRLIEFTTGLDALSRIRGSRLL